MRSPIHKTTLLLIISVTLQLALVCLFQPVSLANEEDTEVGKPAQEGEVKSTCCGGAGPNKIHWERIIDGETVDFGGWYIGREGVAYNGVPTADGSLLHMIAIRLPYPDGQSFPELDSSIHYYNGVNPDLGLIIITQEHTKGEKWLFQIGDRLINDETGFYPGVEEVYFTFGPGAELTDNHEFGSFTSMNGMWTFIECAGLPRLMYGPPGAQWEEVRGDWQKLKWTSIPLPPEYGHFFGFAHAVGEVWKVRFGDETFTAVATEVDPLAMSTDIAP